MSRAQTLKELIDVLVPDGHLDEACIHTEADLRTYIYAATRITLDYVLDHARDGVAQLETELESLTK